MAFCNLQGTYNHITSIWGSQHPYEAEIIVSYYRREVKLRAVEWPVQGQQFKCQDQILNPDLETWHHTHNNLHPGFTFNSYILSLSKNEKKNALNHSYYSDLDS